MDPAKYAEIFLEESREHLNVVNQQLLAWEQEPAATEPVTVIFRSIHNIKGMAATMGYQQVATLSHRVESLLDVLRGDARPIEPALLELLFRAADGLETGIAQAVASGEDTSDVSELVAAFEAAAAALESDAPAAATQARPSAPAMSVPGAAGRGVRVALRPDTPLKGARALILLGHLERAGTVTAVQPAPAVMEGDEFDGRFAFRIDTDLSDEALSELIRRGGDVQEVVIAVAGPNVESDEGRERTRHLRVDLRRLDSLMNLIGEMVTVRGQLTQLSEQRSDPDLEDLVVRISHLTQALQAEIIQARMTPAWQVFDRFPRLVRDVARQLGKRATLRLEGKDIELDRSLLDELGDPLVHMLRNAVDHGIEPPEERTAAGKPAEGTIVLSASRERSTVVIRVTDDGRGIDRDRILERARARGILPADQETLADDQLMSVVAHPGFSTADAVSDVSGRGVGIDVVMSRMRMLGGSLELRTEVGVGSTFTLRLPPTLAIVPALLADVAEERYALPLTHVEETLDLDQVAVSEVEGAESIVIRDQVVPLRRLRRLVGLDDARSDRQPVVILGIGERRSGLVVDRVSSQREIVVKTFDAPVGTVPIFGGATILGDGRPIFILDAARLV